jgi:transposase-like protein
MAKARRNFTGTEKAAILREHLIEKVPISDVCEKRGLQPTVFYQ